MDKRRPERASAGVRAARALRGHSCVRGFRASLIGERRDIFALCNCEAQTLTRASAKALRCDTDAPAVCFRPDIEGGAAP